MFRALVLAVVLGAPMAAWAVEGWTVLDAAAIRPALEGRWLQYEGAAQFFAADGATTYGPSVGDQTSAGRWRVEGDQYCSVWPPSDRWACYGMAESTDGTRIRFTADDGSTTDGTYVTP